MNSQHQRVRIPGAVSSSNGSTERLKAAGIPVLDLNEVGEIDTYIDGADETNPQRQLIKGGGAALTREKIIAAPPAGSSVSPMRPSWSTHLAHSPCPWKSSRWRAAT